MASVVARSETMVWRTCCGRFGPLLTALLALCLAAPGLTGGPLKGGLLDIIMLSIVLTGIYAASPNRRSIVVGLTIATLSLFVHRGVTVFHNEALHGFHYFLTLSILTYALTSILSAVLRDRVVTIETIKGAVCVYLLVGLAWVYLFAVIDMLFPGSFKIAPTDEGIAEGHLLVRRQLPRLLYLSFCTLTTLGYGDIIPLRSPAQTACYLEAIAGQIYLTVLIARLVGMHITQATPTATAPSGEAVGATNKVPLN